MKITKTRIKTKEKITSGGLSKAEFLELNKYKNFNDNTTSAARFLSYYLYHTRHIDDDATPLTEIVEKEFGNASTLWATQNPSDVRVHYQGLYESYSKISSSKRPQWIATFCPSLHAVCKSLKKKYDAYKETHGYY